MPGSAVRVASGRGAVGPALAGVQVQLADHPADQLDRGGVDLWVGATAKDPGYPAHAVGAAAGVEGDLHRGGDQRPAHRPRRGRSGAPVVEARAGHTQHGAHQHDRELAFRVGLLRVDERELVAHGCLLAKVSSRGHLSPRLSQNRA